MQRHVRSVAAVVAATFLIAGCSVFGTGGDTETPDYAVVRTLTSGVEIRRYGERLAAETAVAATPSARNEAFRRLAGYIFGDNAGAEKIAMTTPVATAAAPAGAGERLPAPVATAARGGELEMRFFLPGGIDPGAAP
ncbi:MAG: SOUL family heme-binding protein, partial [Alphaproteobacteria bacterium]